MCNPIDGGNTASKMMYPCENVGARVQKRGKKEQIVVPKKQTRSESVYCITFVVWNHLVFEKMSVKKYAYNLKKEQGGVVLLLFSLKNRQTVIQWGTSDKFFIGINSSEEVVRHLQPRNNVVDLCESLLV